MNVLFLELAEQEFYDSQDYYEEQQTNLGERFKKEIYSALNRIQRFPNMYIKIRKDIRKCIVNIIYFINYILIIAIAHHHRKPDYWVDRIN